MRFGASCCPTWDPSNWLSRKLPSLLPLWISRSQNENQKLLRSASEEEMFQKKPKRKTNNKSENSKNKNTNSKQQPHKSESENNLSAAAVTATNVTTVEIVTEGQQQKLSTPDKEMKTISKIGKVMKKSKQNKNSAESASISSTSTTSASAVSSEAISLNNPRRRRSRREQAVLAAKSSRGGGRGSYTAANLRRYAAEHKPNSMKHDHYMLEKRSQSANALKFSPFNAGTIRLFRCIIWLCLFTYLFY